MGILKKNFLPKDLEPILIKNGVNGITFKYNLTHKEACYEIATSDIGICWRKPGWGDEGEISTKVKEYQMYGLPIIDTTNIFNIFLKTKLYIFSTNVKSSGYFQRTLHILNERQDFLGIYNPFTLDIKFNNFDKNDNTIILRFTRNYFNKIIKILNIDTIILPSNHENFNSIHDFLKSENITKPKLIYEIRGLWFLTSHSRFEYKNNKKLQFSNYILQEIKNEQIAIQNANSLIFINNSIRNYLLNDLKIYEIYTKPFIVLYNSYSINSYNISKKVVNKKYTIGYFGTISHYEGIENLVEVCKKINNKYNSSPIRLVLYGKISDLCSNFNYEKYDFIEYHKFVPHKEYIKKIQEIDLLCIPRLDYKVCEIVPALKPLAAMYYKIPVLISDFPCYREMSPDGFYYFKPGDKVSLMENIENIMNSSNHDNKLNKNFNLVKEKYNWKTQCCKINNLIQYNTLFIYNFKNKLQIWSGAVNNSINEMICLSKFSNVFYNNVFINDLIIKNVLNFNELNSRIEKLLSLKFYPINYISKRQNIFSIEKNKYKYIFYRGGANETCIKEFIKLPNIKFFQHCYNKQIWENEIVGFQTETANLYAKKNILKNKSDDGTLNYQNISIIPKNTFIRYQCITQDVNYKRNTLNKYKEYFTIGIIGTIYDGTDPRPFLKCIDELIKEKSLKIKIIIYSSNILIDIPEYTFISYDSFNNSNKQEKLIKLDLIINTWLDEQQDYSGSNKNLDAICYNIPLIVKNYTAYIKQFGKEYKLYFHDMNCIKNLIEKCYNDIDFYNSIVTYLHFKKKEHIVDVVAKKWERQLLKFM